MPDRACWITVAVFYNVGPKNTQDGSMHTRETLDSVMWHLCSKMTACLALKHQACKTSRCCLEGHLLSARVTVLMALLN